MTLPVAAKGPRPHNTMGSSDPRPVDLRATATRGMSWMAVQTLGTRVLSLSGQLVLGWLLSPADFGLYALALSISMRSALYATAGRPRCLCDIQRIFQITRDPWADLHSSSIC